jgi:PEGA domain
MTPLSATAEQPEAPLFSDGIGDRVVAVDAATGDLLQILRVRPKLLSVPSFEFALRERAARLANFRHAYYARVRRIDRHPTGLAIVSDHVEGIRLSEMLRVAHARSLPLDLNAALCLLRQLVPSIALLHENARDVAHGILAPDRLIVTPRARLVVVEHVLGSAVEQLQFTRERLWSELHVAVPMSAGIARFDHRADVTAIGLVALALVLGRPISEQEYPHRVSQLLNDARARTAGVEDQPLPEALQNWIARALHLDPRQGFASATEAQSALEDALSDDSGFVAAPVALETFLSRYISVMLDPTPPVSAPRASVEPPAVKAPASTVAPSPSIIREFMDAPVAPARPSAPPVTASSPAFDAPARPRVDPPVVSAPRVNAEPPVVSAPRVSVEPPVVSAPRVSVELPKPVEEIKPSFAAMSPVIPPAAPSHAAVTSVINPPRVPDGPAPSAAKPSVEPFVVTPKSSVEPPAVSGAKWSAEPPAVSAPKPSVEPPAVSGAKWGAEPPVASAPKPSVESRVVSGAKASAEPRDITELLRDFDLPPLPSNADVKHDLIEPAWEAPPARTRFAGWRRIAVAGLAIVALAEGGLIAARAYKKPVAPTMGSLSVQTNPPGVSVFVDGVARGNTPARISLNAGSHIVELRGRGVPRVIPVTVTAGSEASQYLELPETPSAGSLLVQSDPAGARVTVDGVDHGVAPVSVADLAPGDHEVVLQAEGGPAVKQRVVIQAGVTSSVLAPVSTASAGPVSGWLSVKAPVSIEIREGGRLIGTTDSDKIMMAAGRHDVELVNDTLGYRVTRSIQVPAGKVAPITIEFPQGVINVNAAPWAEVFVDGKRVGETPIGNLPISIGPHEVIFRHPQFGEKRQAVSVTLKAPVRLSVDMKQQ